MVTKILDKIAYNDGSLPLEFLEKAIIQKEEIIPALLEILENTRDNAAEIIQEDDYLSHIYALYLLAQFREKRAYPLICELLHQPGEILDLLLDEVIVEGLPRILASVCDGDIDLIKQLIENEQIEEYVRGSALRSLVVLVAQDMKPREEIIVYFESLLREILEREHSHVWNALADCSCDLYPKEIIDLIDQAYREDLVDPFYISLQNIKEQLEKNRELVFEELKANPDFQFINNTIEELQDWACFNQDDEYEEEYEFDDDDVITGSNRMNSIIKERDNLENDAQLNLFRQEPIRVEPKVGRNQPCPCGSGKKYKKCCGNK